MRPVSMLGALFPDAVRVIRIRAAISVAHCTKSNAFAFYTEAVSFL